MTTSFLGGGWAGVLGLVGFVGCGTTAPAARRTLYPDFPSPEDALATDPCSVREGPDVFLRNAPYGLLHPLSENIAFLEEANPVFLCGLERIELLGDAEYRASADPEYTRRSVGLYTPVDRVIRLKASHGIALTHEVGHHVHNLGYFASTVREFMAQSWVLDPNTHRRVHRCEGDDCFLSEAAGSGPTEDWARTFEMVLMRPIETGVAVNFSLDEEGRTPLQEKVALMRGITNREALEATVRFGKARVLEASEVPQDGDSEKVRAMPASLGQETIRKIFRMGKSFIRPFVWDNRRRPFLAGDAVIFPAHLPEKKRLGFFAYDLTRNQFLPLELQIKDLPPEFRDVAESFTLLEILSAADGTHLLVGYRDGSLPLAASFSFEFP